MFRETLQSGIISVLYSQGQQKLPLAQIIQIVLIIGLSHYKFGIKKVITPNSRLVNNSHYFFWKIVSDGKIEVVKDEETKTHVVEIVGQNSSTNYIEGPNVHKDGFALKLTWLHILVKNVSSQFGDSKQKLIQIIKKLQKDFSFVVEVVDHKRQKRRFKFSNWFKDTRVKSTVTNIKLKMQEGWNHLVFDIKQICLKSYGTNLQEIVKMVVNASCRLRRIYFAEKPFHLHQMSQIPNDFKVFIQGQNSGKYQEEQEDEQEEEEQPAD